MRLPHLFESPTVDCARVYHVLQGLSQLQRLRLGGIAFNSALYPSPSLLAIKSLELYAIADDILGWRPTAQGIVHVLEMFSEIDGLQFTDFYFTERPVEIAVAPTHAIKVVSFADKAISLNAFYSVLGAIDTQNLRSMYLPTGFFLATAGQVAKASAMFDRLGAQLTDIGFAFTDNAGA